LASVFRNDGIKDPASMGHSWNERLVSDIDICGLQSCPFVHSCRNYFLREMSKRMEDNIPVGGNSIA